MVRPDDTDTKPPDRSPNGGVSIIKPVTSVIVLAFGPIKKSPVWTNALVTGSENARVKFGDAVVSTKSSLADPLNVPSAPLLRDLKSKPGFSYIDTARIFTTDGLPESPINIPVSQWLTSPALMFTKAPLLILAPMPVSSIPSSPNAWTSTWVLVPVMSRPTIGFCTSPYT